MTISHLLETVNVSYHVIGASVTFLVFHKASPGPRPGWFCRYLFYLGKIRTIQLEYTYAKESLLQAAREAPVAALGF
ncbi:hypothetical protein Tco_0824258 [Tanacetum coccineum]|uniref:26S proteasome non-ATPase regulatory subunit 3 N-terminal TPR repeats domain-containing protein n=1 Tax=Tanacetum coccineum TaxID=301880 RepID=A0ABQ5APW3_9ASTR